MITQLAPGGTLSIEFDSDVVTASDVKRKVRQVLSLDLDMSSAFDIIRHDPTLSNIEERIMGIRPYLADTPFEALIKSVLQQQISYRAANVLTKRLVLAASIVDIIGEVQVYQFPSATRILSLGANQLKELGLGYKVDYLLSLSKLVQQDDLNLEELRGQPYSTIRDVLLPLRGVGEWTIQATAIAGLGNFSVFPYSDLGIRNLLGRLYGKDDRMSTAEVQQLADAWGESGPLILYLLMCADVLNLLPASRHRGLKMHKRKQYD